MTFLGFWRICFIIVCIVIHTVCAYVSYSALYILKSGFLEEQVFSEE